MQIPMRVSCGALAIKKRLLTFHSGKTKISKRPVFKFCYRDAQQPACPTGRTRKGQFCGEKIGFKEEEINS
jgi:hypothetical protein